MVLRALAHRACPAATRAASMDALATHSCMARSPNPSACSPLSFTHLTARRQPEPPAWRCWPPHEEAQAGGSRQFAWCACWWRATRGCCGSVRGWGLRGACVNVRECVRADALCVLVQVRACGHVCVCVRVCRWVPCVSVIESPCGTEALLRCTPCADPGSYDARLV